MFQEVLKAAIPTPQEEKELKERAKAFISQLQEAIPYARVSLGGSVAKGTWLRNDVDIDIFVAFPSAYKEKDLASVLKKHLPDMDRVHGSRDYFRKEEKDHAIEVIPILDIRKASEAQNITDVSPLHAKWVKKHTTETLRNEIRIAKLFFQANKLYGAESYIQGFSGYVLEILLVNYGSFEKLIKAIAKWKKPTVIDFAKHHKDIFFEVNDSKLASPLIVIDPVQKGRNASAALSEEKYNASIALAKNYLKQPSSTFFTPKKLDLPKLTKQKKAVVVEVTPLEGKRDVIGSALLKTFNTLARELERSGFTITKKEWEWNDRAYFVYQLKQTTLPKTVSVSGPPQHLQEHVTRFKKKYTQTTIKKGQLWSVTTRAHTEAKPLIKEVLRSPTLRKKIKKTRVL